jgi:GntP family gluconate:H+ symporter
VAVLAVGTFVIPMLRGIGMGDAAIGGFVAVVATAGMIAPPVNVPAMAIADGVNMPFADFSGPLLALSLPVAAFAICWYVASRPRAAMAARQPKHFDGPPGGPLWPGLASLGSILAFWAVLRLFPTAISDPSVPLVLVLGGLIALPAVPRARWGELVGGTFRGVPLELAAVLVAVGVGVQIMTLTGIRGWLVINSMSLPQPWIVLGLLGVPVLGGVLTSIGTANVLGVPFAFANIHQDMIVNVSALSAISALAEFMPPTAIAAVLASYLVGTTSLGQVLRASAIPALVLAVLAGLMLAFSAELAPLIVFRSE